MNRLLVSHMSMWNSYDRPISINCGLSVPRAKTGAANSLAQDDRPAIRVNVHERRCEVGIERCRRRVDGGADGTRHLYAAREYFRCVREHVWPALDFGAVAGPAKLLRLVLGAPRRHGICGVVSKAVRRLSGRRLGHQPASIHRPLRRRPGKSGPPQARLKRPFILESPFVRSHDEQPDRRFRVDSRVVALKASVVPSQVCFGDVFGGLRAEFELFETAARIERLSSPRRGLMTPRPHDQLGQPACIVRPCGPRPPVEHLQGFVKQGIKPTGNEQGGGFLPGRSGSEDCSGPTIRRTAHVRQRRGNKNSHPGRRGPI